MAEKIIIQSGTSPPIEITPEMVQVVDVPEGAVIVLRKPQRITQEAFDRLGRVCRQIFPKHRVLILEEGMSIEVYMETERLAPGEGEQ